MAPLRICLLRLSLKQLCVVYSADTQPGAPEGDQRLRPHHVAGQGAVTWVAGRQNGLISDAILMWPGPSFV